MSKKPKVESIEEYLARGGSVKKLAPVELKEIDVTRKTSHTGVVTIMSLEDADLFYGEARKGAKPKKAKPTLSIDLSALPPALRAKFVTKLKEDSDGEGEGYEEIEEDDGEEE